MWNLKVIAITLVLIISRFVFTFGFDERVGELESEGVIELGELRSLGSEVVEGIDVDGQLNNQSESRESEGDESQDDTHGGSWVDCFEDDSRVEWGMSDNLRLEEGDADKIKEA